jgi:Papain-like cysteine protease AvrRpt2
MRLNVPHFPQEKPNSCWHAAARMLYGFKKAACIHPLPAHWTKDEGIQPSEFVDLAKSVGLRALPKVNQSFGWRFLEDALTRYGPLWAAGQWNGPNHIIVITGVDAGGRVFANDPAFPAPVVRDISWFNAKIDKNVEMPLMYLP